MNSLPNDPNLPPGVSQRDIDRAGDGDAFPVPLCVRCERELTFDEQVGNMCFACLREEDEARQSSAGL
jgi:hypothetical protein